MLPPVAGVKVVDVLEPPNILPPFAPVVAAPNRPLVAGATDGVVFVAAPNRPLPAGLAADEAFAFPKSSPPVAVVDVLLGVLPKRLPGVVAEEVPVLPKILGPEAGNEEFAAPPKMLTAGLLLLPEPKSNPATPKDGVRPTSCLVSSSPCPK